MWCQKNFSRHLLLPALVSAWLAASCGKNDVRRVVTPAFYHWKTVLSLSSAELACLDSLRCQKLYVKVLDIGRAPASGAIQPYSLLDIADTAGLARFEVVPTVFIVNEVFKNIEEEKNEWLARKVASALVAPEAEGIMPQTNLSRHPFFVGQPESKTREIQFDCDWTPSTRDAFFQFLEKIKKHLPSHVRLSATIRLHQYKFPQKTGVPPVERGMLMFYNTGNIEHANAANSIFRSEDVRKYLVGAPKKYPLPLDLALPIFSWALIYRDGELWKIIPEAPEQALSDTSRFRPSRPETFGGTHPTAPLFHIQKGTFLSGHYLRPGDLLRVEAMAPDTLREAARLAATAHLANDATLAFFHLDTTTVRRYPVQLLDSVCQLVQFPATNK